MGIPYKFKGIVAKAGVFEIVSEYCMISQY